MRILYVCHRFPYPPKRGGKIRPFNMIRHLARSHEVVVCSLARSAQEAEEAQGIAPYCSEFHIEQVDETVQRLRMVATLPTHVTASTSYFHSPALQTHDQPPACGAAVRPDLRALLVGCALRPSCARRAPRSSTSATWTRRSGSSTHATSRSRLTSATAWEGQRLCRLRTPPGAPV